MQRQIVGGELPRWQTPPDLGRFAHYGIARWCHGPDIIKPAPRRATQRSPIDMHFALGNEEQQAVPVHRSPTDVKHLAKFAIETFLLQFDRSEIFGFAPRCSHTTPSFRVMWSQFSFGVLRRFTLMM